MKKKRPLLNVEQIEDRLTPSGTPADVYFATQQIQVNTEILRFITDDQLIGNPFLQPFVGSFLDYVHQTNTQAVNEINLFLNNLMGQHAGNPLTANFFADHFVGFSNVLNEGTMGIAYAQSFAGALSVPLSPIVSPAPPPTTFLPPPVSPPPATSNADLSITNTDGSTTYTPGGNISYTVVVRNNGPTNVNGATVSSVIPANLTNVTWSAAYAGGATGSSGGSGNIAATVNIPTTGNVTITVNGSVLANATGNMSHIVTVTPPSGITDPVLSNNTAIDTNASAFTADLSVTNTDGNTTVQQGSNITYTVVVRNLGPVNVTGATVASLVPANLTNVSWSTLYAGGATGTANGTGNIAATMNLPSGGNATITLSGTILGNAVGNLTHSVTVTPPGNFTDPNLANNTATDINVIGNFTDLGMVNTKPADTTTGFTTIVNGVRIKDIVVGAGTSVVATDTINLFYTGWLDSNGTQFDAHRSPNAPIQFSLNGVIDGFRDGIVGMQTGGIRQIFIPADQAYGANGTTGIPPNSDLVFEVKITGIV